MNYFKLYITTPSICECVRIKSELIKKDIHHIVKVRKGTFYIYTQRR